jgi:hypothetical protein
MRSRLVALSAVVIVLSLRAYPCTRVGPVSSVEMVDQADVILRAVAVEYSVAPSDPRVVTTGVPDSVIRFKVLEVLRGEAKPEITLHGYLTNIDDFNEQPAPYNFVRRNGRRGSCFANSYRRGAEFLLVLKKTQSGDLTVNWYALGPVNEQLHSPTDPWLIWVGEQVNKRNASSAKFSH